MTREMHKATWGRPLFDAIVERSPGVDVKVFEEIYHVIVQEHFDNGKMDSIPQVNFTALERLAAENRVLFLLTSRTHTELKHMLEPDHQLASHIKAFYYKDTMQFHKPDPRAFDELLADNNLKSDECIYVGDSVSDAVASKKAGLYFVASLESGLRQKSDFDPRQVDRFINTFPELVAAVAEIEKE